MACCSMRSFGNTPPLSGRKIDDIRPAARAFHARYARRNAAPIAVLRRRQQQQGTENVSEEAGQHQQEYRRAR